MTNKKVKKRFPPNLNWNLKKQPTLLSRKPNKEISQQTKLKKRRKRTQAMDTKISMTTGNMRPNTKVLPKKRLKPCPSKANKSCNK